MLIWIIFFGLILLQCWKGQSVGLLRFNMLFLFLLVALRHRGIGMFDTDYVYMPAYELMKGKSFAYVYELHKEKDVIFYLLSRITQFVSTEQCVYLGVCAFPLFFATYKLIKNYSSNYGVGTILFLTFNFGFSAFTGIRHCLALSFVTWAFMFILNEKKIKAFVIILIASLFHITALTALPLLLVNKIKLSKKQIVWTLAMLVPISLVLAELFSGTIIPLLSSYFSRFETYDGNLTKLNMNQLRFIRHFE